MLHPQPSIPNDTLEEMQVKCCDTYSFIVYVNPICTANAFCTKNVKTEYVFVWKVKSVTKKFDV